MKKQYDSSLLVKLGLPAVGLRPRSHPGEFIRYKLTPDKKHLRAIDYDWRRAALSGYLPLPRQQQQQQGAAEKPPRGGVYNPEDLPPLPKHGDNSEQKPREAGIKPPELDPIAYHGPLGKIVKKMMPHTEASGPSLLVQHLVSIGNLFGRHARVMGGAREHFTNLFAVTVGDSAVGRKGEALAMLKRYVIPTITKHDQKWRGRIVSGAASGEGLIYALRDPVGDDDGADDKRLLLEESEFGGLLTVIDRKDNKLGEILRDAWDGVDLNNMAMKNRDAKTRAFLKASNYHVSLNAHVTKAELNQKLPVGARTANGLANRILWVYSRRENILAQGGNFSAEMISSELADIIAGVQFASKIALLSLDGEAEPRWEQFYNDFHERIKDDDSEFARIIARGDVQTKRIALIFALLDCSPVIRIEHLEAAIAIWRYCERSARWAFFEGEFSPTAQRIHDFIAFKPDGRATLTEIQNSVFRNNLSKARMDAAIGELEKARVARIDVKTLRKTPPQIIKTVVLISP